jgi:hypothetical protein
LASFIFIVIYIHGAEPQSDDPQPYNLTSIGSSVHFSAICMKHSN